ncbi:hypothetical protein BOX15_Mlig027518g1 [Macrostomum lignano]|nr:hypothetical protein BOX15_Mlig027518g1 [Macrostomum lignano]
MSIRALLAVLLALIVSAAAVRSNEPYLSIQKLARYHSDSLLRFLCIAGPDDRLPIRLHCGPSRKVCYENCQKTLQCSADPLCSASTCERRDWPDRGEFVLGFSFFGDVSGGVFECRYMGLVRRLEVASAAAAAASSSSSVTPETSTATTTTTKATTTTATTTTTTMLLNTLKTSTETAMASPTLTTASTSAVVDEVPSSSPPIEPDKKTMNNNDVDERSFLTKFSFPVILLACILAVLCTIVIVVPFSLCLLICYRRASRQSSRQRAPPEEAQLREVRKCQPSRNEYVMADSVYEPLDFGPTETSSAASERQSPGEQVSVYYSAGGALLPALGEETVRLSS